MVSIMEKFFFYQFTKYGNASVDTLCQIKKMKKNLSPL